MKYRRAVNPSIIVELFSDGSIHRHWKVCSTIFGLMAYPITKSGAIAQRDGYRRLLGERLFFRPPVLTDEEARRQVAA